MKYHCCSYPTHTCTHTYTVRIHGNSFLASDCGRQASRASYLFLAIFSDTLCNLCSNFSLQKGWTEKLREGENRGESEKRWERGRGECEGTRNAAKTFKCGTLFINVERSIWGGHEQWRRRVLVQGERWPGRTSQARTVCYFAARRRGDI